MYISQKKFTIKETSLKKPISYYGKTKRLAEKYVSKNIKNYCVGRIFAQQIKTKEKII